ncbi:hypothetical protein D3C72_942330 [compost metagenome]
MKHFALALIISFGASSFGLAQSFSNFSGNLPAVLQIHDGSSPKRVTTTCKVKMSILEDAQQFKISNGEFQCGEISWNESITLFKKNGVLYDRLGVAVGNLYDSGTLQFPSSQGTQFEYLEKTFDSHCKIIGTAKRTLPLAQTVIYAFQPAQSGYNLSVEIYWEKPVGKRPSSSCPGAEAWGKVEDAGRIKGVLKTL